MPLRNSAARSSGDVSAQAGSAAWAAFTLPSAIVLVAFAYSLASLESAFGEPLGVAGKPPGGNGHRPA